MNYIPSFVFGVPPTRDSLNNCRTAGLIQAAVTTYVDANDYYAMVNYGALPPTVGPPRYWIDPNANVALGAMFLTGQVHVASAMSLVENLVYSQSAHTFYAERPQMLVPAIAYSVVSDWRALSFLEGLADPQEYPLGQVWMYSSRDSAREVESSFPTNIVLFMQDGKPAWATVDEAHKLFPIKPQMPTGAGSAVSSFNASDILHVAVALNSGSSKRIAAQAILSGNLSDIEKAKGIVAL
jgi:hypothetical protein